jgi:hypothetical protein
MAGYFAELKDNIVQRVISSETKEWCVDTLGGEWVQTYYSTPGKNYAGIGDEYVPSVDNFKTQSPFPSWELDKNLQWQAPVKKPSDEGLYYWDEDKLIWIKK